MLKIWLSDTFVYQNFCNSSKSICFISSTFYMVAQCIMHLTRNCYVFTLNIVSCESIIWQSFPLEYIFFFVCWLPPFLAIIIFFFFSFVFCLPSSRRSMDFLLVCFLAPALPHHHHHYLLFICFSSPSLWSMGILYMTMTRLAL